ncbi:MAG: ribosome-associated translation inhibitor RaiA [Alphaproteobacteria bacterium]|nr:ribosome-associated translation inhibitor RaiA [Alphaproteobacteria bacterium]
MRISVSSKQFDVSQGLADRVRASLEHSVARYFDRAIDAQIAFSKQGAGVRADVSVHAGRGLTVQTHGQAVDPWLAFGEAEEKVAKRLRRHKRRLRNHHRREETEFDRWSVAHRILDEPEGVGEEAPEESPAIIAEMTDDVLTLSVGEAVMHMDFGGRPALLFRNAAHGGLNMIYRRADGNVGWVDPDGLPGPGA